MRTARAVSAGGVVLSEPAADAQVALIARRSAGGALQWTLPKGTQEPGESITDTALREVSEETGLKVELLSELEIIDYWFVWSAEQTRYHKLVHYYLMRATGGDLSRHDSEPGGLAPIQSWWPGDGSAVVAPGATLGLPVHSEPLPTWLLIRTPGMVLPLVLRVSASSDQGPASSRLTTFVVATAGKVHSPLRISLLVPLHEQTHRNPAGDFVDDKLGKLLAANGSLGAIAAELARPDAPKVSLLLAHLLTDEATAMGGSWKFKGGGRTETVSAGDPRSLAAKKFLQDLRVAASHNLPAALPYANADLPSLVRAGSDAEALAPLLYARKHPGVARTGP